MKDDIEHKHVEMLTGKDLRESLREEYYEDGRNKLVGEELLKGFEIISKYPKSVTFFGSSRFREDNKYYKEAREIARRIAEDLKYAIVSGGGPGIMEAANRGARDGGGKSIGFSIKLPTEQMSNEYIDEEINFFYFFTRKVSLAFSAEAYLFFPGGFGTLDEFFEMATLVQTRKIENIPVILVGSEYWNKVDNLIKETLLQENATIDGSDLNIYTITDDVNEILSIIRRAPPRKT